MRQRYYITLGVIILLLAAVIWINVPNNGGIHIGSFDRTLETVLGLDLRGGLQILMEADIPADTQITQQSLEDAVRILENRTNALGVSENLFQVAGNRRIVGEFPGETNPDRILSVLKETGMLEFVDVGSNQVSKGSKINTDFGLTVAGKLSPTATPTTLAPTAAAAPATPAVIPTASAPGAAGTDSTVYHTVMTGKELKKVGVEANSGQFMVSFELTDEGRKLFSDHTTNHTGQFLAIVLDKKVMSAPVIKTPITDGKGVIEGGFTADTANDLAITLRYGSLPIPLKVVESRVIGPTLGQDSLDKSLRAGIIGFIIVALFMLLYYRAPGLLADVVIVIYALITLAIFRLIPVTLTLPGIAGFLLSTGSALDANILIFERLKEELRAGKPFHAAIQQAWKRAWPSIRDSNIATLITSAILFWFGSQFGASIVKGFSFTLALGVLVSLFTSIVVTRTLLNVVVDLFKPERSHIKWFGVLE